MRVIFLIGFMGSGKSTLGRALAQRVPGCAFIDLDEEIERRAGMSVREIFDTLGQERFRALEADTLRSLCPPEGTQVCVVATGGGTPCRPGAMEWMNAAGTTVLLRASDAVLLRRLLQAQGSARCCAAWTPPGWLPSSAKSSYAALRPTHRPLPPSPPTCSRTRPRLSNHAITS